MTFKTPFSSARFWLEARYPYDVRARNRDIERLVKKDFRSHRFIRILDLGAGLGANFRYYSDTFDCDQAWFCVEEDPALSESFVFHIKKWAVKRGWSCRAAPSGVILRRERKTIAVHLLPGSFIPFPGELAKIPIELAMANAVFDLLSRRHFSSLAQSLASRSIPLLATLNYSSMRFAPSQAGDKRMISLYERTMELPSPRGTPMGSGCTAAMEIILEARGYSVIKGESVWTVSRDAPGLLDPLLGFMQSSVSSFPREKTESKDLGNWVAGKKAGIASGEIKLLVRHRDLYARLPLAKASSP